MPCHCNHQKFVNSELTRRKGKLCLKIVFFFSSLVDYLISLSVTNEKRKCRCTCAVRHCYVRKHTYRKNKNKYSCLVKGCAVKLCGNSCLFFFVYMKAMKMTEKKKDGNIEQQRAIKCSEIRICTFWLTFNERKLLSF